MTKTAAHIRRSVALLEWIDSTQPDARVSLGTVPWGSWHELDVRWRLEGGRIRLQLHRRDRSLVLWIASALPAPWGAQLKICDRGRPAEVNLAWGKNADEISSISNNLLRATSAWVRSALPGARVLSASRSVDRAHSLSGGYIRLRLRLGNVDHLVLICPEVADAAVVHSTLTQALLWLALLRDQRRLEAVPMVHLLVPMGDAAVVCHRSRLVSAEHAHVDVLEYARGSSGQLETRRPAPPDPPLENRDFRWPVLGPFRWSSELSRVMDLAPGAIQRYPRFDEYDSLRLWGLEFARVFGDDRDRISFGIGPRQTELNEDNFDELRALVDEITYYRRADSPAPDHPYYRMQAERWLECLLITGVNFLFPELMPGYVYPQIPVYLGKVPGRVDVLGVDMECNLVVMELKVSEDPDMPLQSLDYWGRVIAHNLGGDFERRGYFAGLRLSRARPRIYLVSPVFSFHDSLERVMRCLDPELEVSKIAINEDWRGGVKVVRRQDYKCGDLVRQVKVPGNSKLSSKRNLIRYP